MHLFLSTSSALNCIYFTEFGRPMFKVETRAVALGETRRTIIRRAVDTVDGVWLGDRDEGYHEDMNNASTTYNRERSRSPNSTSASDSEDVGTFEGHFAHLAHIEYSALKPSRILYAGREMRTNRLFRAEGWSWYGMSRHQVFVASDGCEYRWVIGSKNPKLVTNDSCKRVVARFHRPKGGFTLKPTSLPSSLEVYPEGEAILNDILITFVYLRDAEES